MLENQCLFNRHLKSMETFCTFREKPTKSNLPMKFQRGLNLLVEDLLQSLVRQVDEQLLERIRLKALKSRDIQNTFSAIALDERRARVTRVSSSRKNPGFQF